MSHAHRNYGIDLPSLSDGRILGPPALSSSNRPTRSAPNTTIVSDDGQFGTAGFDEVDDSDGRTNQRLRPLQPAISLNSTKPKVTLVIYILQAAAVILG